MKPPQRLVRSQGFRDQLAHCSAQRRLAITLFVDSKSGQVIIHVDLRQLFPKVVTALAYRTLTKALVLGQQSLLQQRLEFILAHGLIKKQQAIYHHQILVGIHAQPSRIDVGHWLPCQLVESPHNSFP